MAADTNVEDILAIDSSLIPPGFTHGLQIAIPQSPPQLGGTFQQPEKLQPRPQQKLPPRPSQQFQRPRQQQRPQQKPPPPIPPQNPQEQAQVQQKPNPPQKQKAQSSSRGSSFCRWVRRKLWCLRGNSPVELNLSDESADKAPKEPRKPVTGDGHADDLKKSVHDTSDRATQMTVGRSGSVSSKSDRSVEGGKTKPKDRQVTFSDTVRTHIKTKYVTAEEYKQIRGMNAATGRIMYQIVKVRDGNDHPKDKCAEIIEEEEKKSVLPKYKRKNTFFTNNAWEIVTNRRRIK